MASEEDLGRELEQVGEMIARFEVADYTPALAGGARETAGSGKRGGRGDPAPTRNNVFSVKREIATLRSQ